MGFGNPFLSMRKERESTAFESQVMRGVAGSTTRLRYESPSSRGVCGRDRY